MAFRLLVDSGTLVYAHCAVVSLKAGYHCHSVNDLRVILLIDFLLTVKVATLIFISGRGSAISPAKEGKSGSFIIW